MHQGKPHRTGTAAVTRSSVLTGTAPSTPPESNEMRQISPEVLKGTQLGSSGGLGLIGGFAGGVVKGAFNLVKNVLSRGSGVKGATGYTPGSAVTKWVNTKAKSYLAKPKTPGVSQNAMARADMTKSLNNSAFTAAERKGAINLLKKSKPVNFKGANPMHKTGAGGNSYPPNPHSTRTGRLQMSDKKKEIIN